MPNLPETGEAPVTQVATQQGPLKRAAVESVLNSLPPESTKENTFLGTGSAAAVAAKGEANVAYGAGALAAVTTGGENTAVGWNALTAVKTGAGNTAVGTAALSVVLTGGNTAVGAFAGQNTTGGPNTFVGEESGLKNAAGAGNTYVGYKAAEKANEEGAENNTAVGHEALSTAAKLKGKNVALGAAAGKENEGEGNVFVGFGAGQAEKGSNKLYVANNPTSAIITGVMSATAASNELGLGTSGGKIGFLAAAATPVVAKAAGAETTAAIWARLKELGLTT